MISKLVMSIVLSALPALAQSIDGGTARKQCEQALKTGGAGSECAGYVRGLLDANELWYAAMLKEKHLAVVPKSYCAPDNLQAKDAANVFVEWIKKHPEYETQSAANAFVLAMREKYSCR